MPHILRNDKIKVHIDLPHEGYHFSRFDWTGKITAVRFEGVPITIGEKLDSQKEDLFGKGFYNEFGIDTALGFDEAARGDWFHKIGVGLLKKDTNQYAFSHPYEIKPAEFNVDTSQPNKLVVICRSEAVNGYSYLLRKEISLAESGFTVHYRLENTGEKVIQTDEYVHNFLTIHQFPIGPDYELKFPFQIRPDLFGETVNPESKVIIGAQSFSFNDQPNREFFFSHIEGHEEVQAQWELINPNENIAVRESCSFPTTKINLWGKGHVICPELFHQITLEKGEATEWFRTYHVYELR